MADVSLDTQLHSIVDKIFEKYDADNNLVLDETELRQFINDGIGRATPEASLKKLLTLVDRDKDRQVTKEEVFFFLRNTFQP